MKALLDLVASHKAGAACGAFAVCSTHPLVIEAALRHAKARCAPFVLIEATSSQVNQDGGYTGMTPFAFREFVFEMADRVGLDRSLVVLGGGCLGPNVWTALPAHAAMDKAKAVVAAYVAAGFRKIHLDCSMSCADDPPLVPEAVVAGRAAWLCAIAEAVWARFGDEPPVYVIGAELPAPGGAAETLKRRTITDPAAATARLEAHRQAFLAAGLGWAWSRVIGQVVQPGVGFGHHRVLDYAPEAAAALSRSVETLPGIIYEAHATDHQSAAALARLVADHFAILKVGPAATFALREALRALDLIEAEWLGFERSGFRARILAAMFESPRHWEEAYGRAGADLPNSLGGPVRDYWTYEEVEWALEQLFWSFSANPPPLAVVRRRLPSGYAAVRRGAARLDDAKSLVLAHVGTVFDDYHAATSNGRESACV